MVLDHTKVVYTAEDEQGFTFRQINDEDAAVELRARRKKRNRWVLIAFVALLIGMVISTFFNFDGSDIFVCLYYVIVPSLTLYEANNSHNPSIYQGCGCFHFCIDMYYF